MTKQFWARYNSPLGNQGDMSPYIWILATPEQIDAAAGVTELRQEYDNLLKVAKAVYKHMFLFGDSGPEYDALGIASGEET